MRFIHTGDIHWGMTPDADKPWGNSKDAPERAIIKLRGKY